MKGKQVLITGGAGFIGSHLADQLLERGHRVRVLDCLLPQVHGEGCKRPAYHQGLKELAEWLEGQVATDRVVEARKELEARGLTV
jgi:dTDP-L-rhamnose 4-epimerase